MASLSLQIPGGVPDDPVLLFFYYKIDSNFSSGIRRVNENFEKLIIIKSG